LKILGAVLGGSSKGGSQGVGGTFCKRRRAYLVPRKTVKEKAALDGEGRWCTWRSTKEKMPACRNSFLGNRIKRGTQCQGQDVIGLGGKEVGRKNGASS